MGVHCVWLENLSPQDINSRRTPRCRRKQRVMPSHEEIPDEGIARLDALISEEKLSGRSITVNSSLDKPHPLVAKAKAILSKQKEGERGVVAVPRLSCLDIRVSPKSLERALCLMDTIIKELESRKYKVSLREVDGKYFTAVTIEGEEMMFGIDEKTTRTKRLLTKEELKSLWLRPLSDYTYEFNPTGLFALRIRNVEHYNTRSLWSDSTSHKLEVLVDSFLIGLMNAAIAIRCREIENAIKARKQAQFEQNRHDALKRINEEETRIKKLDDDATSWQKSLLIRDYVAAVKEKASRDEAFAKDNDVETWSVWALQYADRLDPLTKSPPSILDEKDKYSKPYWHYNS